MPERRVVVVEYDPAWQEAYRGEANRIQSALASLMARIHHIGSTAVPGLAAKPIIDILVEVASVRTLDANQDALLELGYEAKGEYGLPGRRYFRKNNAVGTRTHQIHGYQIGNPEIERHLAFRDYLIAHPEVAEEYGQLKIEQARRHPADIEAYLAAKDPFIREHEARAISWKFS